MDIGLRRRRRRMTAKSLTLKDDGDTIGIGAAGLPAHLPAIHV